MTWFLVFIAAYFIGSISPAYFLGKFWLKKDLSKEGSGNLGARNSLEVGGLALGVSVFLLDCLKGAGAILLVKFLSNDPLLIYLGMLGVIIGHNYSIYLGFRGGKGLAAMIGVVTVINIYALFTMLVIFGLLVFISRSSSVAAILGILPFSLVFMHFVNDWRSLFFTLPLTVIILRKHRAEEYVTVFNFCGLQKK